MYGRLTGSEWVIMSHRLTNFGSALCVAEDGYCGSIRDLSHHWYRCLIGSEHDIARHRLTNLAKCALRVLTVLPFFSQGYLESQVWASNWVWPGHRET